MLLDCQRSGRVVATVLDALSFRRVRGRVIVGRVTFTLPAALLFGQRSGGDGSYRRHGISVVDEERGMGGGC